jgi:ketosteroid isomerase-like protein
MRPAPERALDLEPARRARIFPMNVAENKQLIRDVYAALSGGNSRPFVDALADDVRWHMIGTTSWSGTYQGKQVVVDTLLRPLGERFAERYTATVERLVAEGDLVVAEVRGHVMTKAGMRYDNTYCFIYRIVGGRVAEITEYLDTALVDAALRGHVRER